MTCPVCDGPSNPSSIVAVVLIWAQGAQRPFRLLPAEDYYVCANEGCESVLLFIRRAMDAHPQARMFAEAWTTVEIAWNTEGVKPWHLTHRRPDRVLA